MKTSYNEILNIPERTVINKRLTKAFFLRNFELSTSEKKVLNSIVSMAWLASIKPSNSNIPEVINNLFSYEEIQVFICSLSDNQLSNLSDKCINLFQKFIPYQMVIIVEDENDFMVSACDTRINQSDKSKRSIEAVINSAVISKLYKNEITDAFFKALDFEALDKTNLETLYKSYINSVVQFQTANVTGTFRKRSSIRTEEDLKHLDTIQKIEKEILTLTNQIKKETQQNIRVSLNIEIQEKRKKIEELKNILSKP